MSIKCALTGSDNSQYFLTEGDSIEVPENRYALLLTNIPKEKGYSLRLNDESISLLKTSEFSMPINLINTVGFNRLEVIRKGVSVQKFEFFTSTAKVLRDEYYRMIDFVSNHILSDKGQFVYYDKNKVMHKIINPLFIINWVDKHFNEIERLIIWIQKNAHRESFTYSKKSFSLASTYSKKATMSHFRNNKEMLLKSADNTGLLKVGGQSFDPQSFVTQKTVQHYKLNEHMQIFELLSEIYWFLSNFDKQFYSARYKEIRESIRAKITERRWLERISFLHRSTFLSDISSVDIKYIRRTPISTLQLSNHYYGAIYALYKNFLSSHYRFIDKYNEQFYQHIKNIDAIYESFCCYVLADILGLENVRIDFLSTGKAFYNHEYSLYYRSKPASIKGWGLSDSPDIIIKHKRNGKFLILDCKFKVRDGNVKGEDVQKIQAYLNNYFQQEGAILYPGTEMGAIEDTIKHLYKIYKIPIVPWDKDTYKQKKEEIRLLIQKALV